MANPDTITCTADTWTLVAEDVQSCIIHKIGTSPATYKQTYRVANDSAPSDDTDAAAWLGQSLVVNFDYDVDIYIKAVTYDGDVRIDT